MKLIEEFTEEWISENGNITCEFSAKAEDLPEIAIAINRVREKLSNYGGYWSIQACPTCQKHHGEEYFCHVEILNNR